MFLKLWGLELAGSVYCISFVIDKQGRIFTYFMMSLDIFEFHPRCTFLPGALQLRNDTWREKKVALTRSLLFKLSLWLPILLMPQMLDKAPEALGNISMLQMVEYF